ncbi:MAG TPA: A24 family peptidase [Patescibacteria group bacterium]|nr:A24 family peptidase [Patescibacteria group bacterium]
MESMASIARQPQMLVVVATAIAAAVTDARTRRIPNLLVASAAVMGLLLNAWLGGPAGLLRSALGLLVGFGVFLPFYLVRGMGGGDVKLMAALGACLGALAILQTALVASFVGAVYSLVVAMRHGLLRRTLRGVGRLLGGWLRHGPRTNEELSLDNPSALKIPYALPIAAGALFIVFSAS